MVGIETPRLDLSIDVLVCVCSHPPHCRENQLVIGKSAEGTEGVCYLAWYAVAVAATEAANDGADSKFRGEVIDCLAFSRDELTGL